MRPTEFITALKKQKAGPAYFLRGPDRFLQEECRAAVIQTLPPEAREWCLAEIEFQGGHLARELEAAGQMPMLGGHSYFIFSDSNDLKSATDDDYEALAAYLERPSPFATLIFIASEPDRRRRFIQILEKKAELVELTPLTVREAARWLTSYLERRGVAIAPELAEEVAGKFESSREARGEAAGRGGVNLVWLRTEIEKVLTARPGATRIESADLELIVAVREEHEIGKLLASIADRRYAEAVAQLRALVASKESEVLILWCIADLFRQALKSGGRVAYGRGTWGRGSNPYSTFEIAPRLSKTFSQAELLRGLRAVRRADLAVKSSWKDSRILLEFLLWEIIVGKGAEGAAPGEISAEDFPQTSVEA
jgi:DNA polymerase III delta subunit